MCIRCSSWPLFVLNCFAEYVALLGRVFCLAIVSKAVTDLNTEMKAATQIRNSERAMLGKTEKDLSEIEETCDVALQVLRDYYTSSASFIQATSEASTQAKAKDGSGILGEFEFASSDFDEHFSDIRVSEGQAVDNYNELAQESK